MAAPAETTIVLMGRTGSDKSSTGNSILGKSAFRAGFSATAVTSTCQLESAAIDVGQSRRRIVRVIDTPDIFAASESQVLIPSEIRKCLSLAPEGVHAVVLVLSVRNRFTDEEARVVESLQSLFGKKVMKYMIVLFTGGDVLQEEETTLAEHTSGGTGPFRTLLSGCDGRMVLFDNRTGDKRRQERQVADLLQAVDAMVRQNGGKPYTNLLEEAVGMEAWRRWADRVAWRRWVAREALRRWVARLAVK